jgi:DNA-directed RNA polymerase subunit beta'
VTAESEDERRLNFERIYVAADKRMTELVVDQIPDDNGFKWMMQSGARGSPSKLKQLLGAPVIVEDISRRPFQNPVTRSYAEGLDPASYWSTLYGSRMGIIDRALSTVEPGALNKSLLHTTVNYTVTARDCGTKRGKRYRVDSPDLVGRYLAEPAAGVGRDDPITPRIRSKLEKAGIQEVRVRTPLYCETPQGVCARCWGTDELGNEVQKGTNAGVISGQSITEPMTQMVLSAFHSGGQVKNTDQMASTQLEAIRGLLELPTGPRNKAIVAQKAGRIEKVEKTSVGGFDVTIAGKVHAVPPRKDLIDTIREGAMIEAGDALSVGIKDPRDVMKLKGPYAAREHIADTLHQIYSGGGKRIPRKHFETVAAAVANTTRVRVAPEDSPYIAGDIAPLDEINRFNVTGASKKVPLREGRGKALLDDIEAVGGLGKILTDADLDRLSRLGMTTVNVNPDSVFHEPVLKGINMAPLTRKDFLSGMAFRNLKKVVTQGAAEGWTSDLRGGSPLPAFIYGELEAPEDYPLVV